MKVRLQFKKGGPKKPLVVDMKTVPRVGESLVSGMWGVREVTRVVHTPETSEQDVILELGSEEGE